MVVKMNDDSENCLEKSQRISLDLNQRNYQMLQYSRAGLTALPNLPHYIYYLEFFEN